jgi:hypothetical protein
MDTFEATNHSFIVRIWLEEPETGSTCVSWRGYISHVPNGRRQYLTTLSDITAYIEPHVRSFGIQFDRHRFRPFSMPRWPGRRRA